MKTFMSSKLVAAVIVTAAVATATLAGVVAYNKTASVTGMPNEEGSYTASDSWCTDCDSGRCGGTAATCDRACSCHNP